MRSRFRHWETVAVRWGDMDAMGHVNNAKYFTYCESARMGYFQAIRLDQHRENEQQGPALVSATCNFKRQLRYPAELEVGARVSDVRNRSFTFEYVLYLKGTEELVADGTSVVAWVDYRREEAVPLPWGLRRAIREFEDLKIEVRGEGDG